MYHNIKSVLVPARHVQTSFQIRKKAQYLPCWGIIITLKATRFSKTETSHLQDLPSFGTIEVPTYYPHKEPNKEIYLARNKSKK